MQRLRDLSRRLSGEIATLKGIYQNELYTILPYCRQNDGLHRVYHDIVLKCNGQTLLKKYFQMHRHYLSYTPSESADDTIRDVLLDTLKTIYQEIMTYQNEISRALGVGEVSVDALRDVLNSIHEIAPQVNIPRSLLQCLDELDKVHDIHSELMLRNDVDDVVFDESFLCKNDIEIQMDNDEFIRRGQENFEKFNLEQEEKSQKVANHQLRNDPRIIT
jgi:hypothetical protein